MGVAPDLLFNRHLATLLTRNLSNTRAWSRIGIQKWTVHDLAGMARIPQGSVASVPVAHVAEPVVGASTTSLQRYHIALLLSVRG